MRIRMLKTSRGADDGFTVISYMAGTEYDLSHTPRALELASVFLREGWAELVTSAPPPRTQKVRRVPLIEEFVAAGYQREHYSKMLVEQQEAAERAGEVAEIRERTAEELALEQVPALEPVKTPEVLIPEPPPTPGASPQAAKRKGK